MSQKLLQKIDHLKKTRTVTNKTSIHGVGSFFFVDHTRNPKYGDIKYDDPRNDETWTQTYWSYYDVLTDIYSKLEN